MLNKREPQAVDVELPGIGAGPLAPPRYRHVAVEGPIGVGKTSLARKLAAHWGARAMLEQPESNPFLERFYRDPKRHALATQLFFLFQRVQQIRDLTQLDLFEASLVSDFLIDKDALFAQLNLADDELNLYDKVHAQLVAAPPAPDLVIYLQAPVDALVARVQRRGLAMESGISETYLRQLAERYARFFLHYDAAPVLIVNNEHLNPIDRAADFALLLSRIEQMRGRREFFSYSG